MKDVEMTRYWSSSNCVFFEHKFLRKDGLFESRFDEIFNMPVFKKFAEVL